MAPQPSDYFSICAKVFKATDLPHPNISSMASIRVGNQQKFTSSVKHTDKPFYNEYFVFDLFTDFTTLMNTIITISIFEPRKRIKSKKLIGCVSMDVGTVWAQPDRRLKKWLTLSLPSDVTAQVTAFLQCDINIEAAERFKKLPNLAPVDSPDVVGGMRARYILKLYHCIGLEVDNEIRDIFIRISFAGRSRATTKRQLREFSEWNEQIAFIEFFPPLYQKLTVELIVGKNVFGSKAFYLSDVSNISKNGYLPTFGPTYVHLYANECIYRASLLMALDTEFVTLFKHLEKFHGTTMSPTLPIPKERYGPTESFLCFGVLFDAVFNGSNYLQKDVRLALNFGSVGRRPTKENAVNTTTDKYKPLSCNSSLVFLPLNNQKPCIFIQSEWPNTRHRLSNSNTLDKLANQLRERVNYAHELISRGNGGEAKELLKASLNTFKNECSKTSGKLSEGVTKLDSERLKFLTKQLNQLSSTSTGGNSVDVLLEKASFFLSVMDTICEDIQDSLPSVIFYLKQGQQIIGFSKIHPRQVISSSNEIKKGSLSGKITSLILYDENHKNIGRLDIWLWLGFWAEVSHCLQELPPGHENVKKVVSLPLAVTYNTNEIYTAVCHIFEGHISGSMDSEGLCDSFVRVMISNQSQQTNTIKRSLTPVWKQTLLFSDLQLYPTPSYIQQNPPSITVELWDQTSKPESLLGTSLVSPRVRLQPISTVTEYNLQWIQLGDQFEVLAAFEMIQMSNEINSDRSSNNRLSKVIPQFIDPPTDSFRLEIVFWGIRALDTTGLKSITRPQVIIQCDTAEVISDVMVNANAFPNFQHNLQATLIELPKTKLYSPPMVLRVIASAKYVGCDVDKNVYRYVIQLPTRKEREALSTQRVSVVDRAKARHHSFQTTMPDLIPLMEIDSKKRFSSMVQSKARFRRRFLGFFSSCKRYFVYLKSFIFTIESKVNIDILDDEEDNDEEYDWWYKYFSGKIVLYPSELEDQQTFEGFNDVLKTFLVKHQKSGVSKDVVKVKAMLCLYQWPIEKDVVTPQGRDPDMGVLEHSEISDKVKLLVRVYCIKAHHLHPADPNGKADPYIEIATQSNRVSDEPNHIPRQLSPVFGSCLEISAAFPIDTLLAVRVMDWDRFSVHDIIGETIIDLEDRFYSKHRGTCGLASTFSRVGPDAWRDVEKPTDILEKLCNMYNLPLPQYYEKSVLVASKEFLLRHKTKDNEDNQERLALTALHNWNEVPVVGKHLVKEHVETRSLYKKDRPGLEQGKLEMWVDLFDLSLGPVPPPVDIGPRKPQPYELRVVIWNTAKVPLVDDSYFVGKKHTDIFVKGWLWDPNSSQSTDVHYTSVNGEGSFNWRFIFPFLYYRPEKKMCIYKKVGTFDIGKTEVKVPALLHIQVWDSDRISTNDFIGSMVMELCAMPRGARSVKTCKMQSTSNPSNPVDLFRVRHLRGWWPFLRAQEKDKPTSGGYLEAEIHILTADEAIASPAGLGRSEPAALPPPIRPEFSTKFWLAPIRIIIHLLCGVHKGKMIMCLCVFGISIFVLIGIYSIPMFLIKRVIEAV